jgi:3-methyladenine DNA glycosylase/8-oxoguanine DNA glycosylase
MRSRGHARIERVKIDVCDPFDADLILDWLGARAIPGVERVEDGTYIRGTTRVTFRNGALHTSNEAAKVRILFDADADPHAIASVLARDPMLAPRLAKLPGVRVPGVWSAFELCIRAIVGQQISVARARTILGHFAATCGLTPEGLAELPYGGMPGKRTETIRALARGFVEGTIDPERDDLTQLPGIGPWTASYIRMRLGNHDAFPAGDLILRRNAGNMTERALAKRSEQWQPYRGYAAMLLWNVPEL